MLFGVGDHQFGVQYTENVNLYKFFLKKVTKINLSLTGRTILSSRRNIICREPPVYYPLMAKAPYR